MTSAQNVGVIVVDMQQYFLGSIPNRRSLLEAQLEVLGRMKGKLPVLILEYNGCGETVAQIKPYATLPTITKYTDNGFFDTPLEQTLRENEIETTLLMGINRGACVISTARGALAAGFGVATADTIISGAGDWTKSEKEFYQDKTTFTYNHADLLQRLSL